MAYLKYKAAGDSAEHRLLNHQTQHSNSFGKESASAPYLFRIIDGIIVLWRNHRTINTESILFEREEQIGQAIAEASLSC